LTTGYAGLKTELFGITAVVLLQAGCPSNHKTNSVKVLKDYNIGQQANQQTKPKRNLYNGDNKNS